MQLEERERLATQSLRDPLTETARHLCIDMQRMFGKDGPWATPWIDRVLPVVHELASRFPERTVFTRFITPAKPTDMPGLWRRYYERWIQTTRDVMDPQLLELLEPLARLVPPATVLDKSRYSAFCLTPLHQMLQQRGVDTLLFSGSETDVCVLSTIMDAVDLGYRSIIVRNGICSSSDDGHDSMMTLYEQRFTEQVETADAEEILARWS
jgi:nicotinamidase-related amidase